MGTYIEPIESIRDGKKPKQAKESKMKYKTGDEMMSQPFFHIDESFWMCVLAYMCYQGDYLVLAYAVFQPALTYTLCSLVSYPGAEDARDNIVPIDLRTEYKTPDDLMRVIKGGESEEFTAKAEDRPNAGWVGYFASHLRPSKMDHLNKDQMRIFGIKSQGETYLSKGSNICLAMCIYSIVSVIWALRDFGLYDIAKIVMVFASTGNLAHILRDHSISGLAHHTSFNVGEFDKWEYIKAAFIKTSLGHLLGLFLGHISFFKGFNVATSLNSLAYVNHTLTHYNQMDIKGKGPAGGQLWQAVMNLQRFLASCKLICSKQYHSLHHFHNEMSCPAILIVFNEYLNSNALRPFLKRKMSGKALNFVEKVGVRWPLVLALLYMVSATRGTAWF